MLESFTTTLGGFLMANTKLNLDKIFQLVMECRQSGLSDRQWCIEHEINPSTFYYWIKKLRDKACYDVPENTYHGNNQAPACVIKQDVVRVDIIPDASTPPCTSSKTTNTHKAPVVIQYQQANILIQDHFNPHTLKDVLMILKETLC